MTFTQQLECAERELKMRERVYPWWVDAEKLTREKAEHEIAAMRAIVETLRPLAAKESDQPELFS